MPLTAALIVALLALVSPAGRSRGEDGTAARLVGLLVVSALAHVGLAALWSTAPGLLVLLAMVGAGLALIATPFAIGRSWSGAAFAVGLLVVSLVAHVGVAALLGRAATLGVAAGQLVVVLGMLGAPALMGGTRRTILRLYGLVVLSLLVHAAVVSLLAAPSWFFWLAGSVIAFVTLLGAPIALGQTLPFALRLYLTLALSLGGHVLMALGYTQLELSPEPEIEPIEMTVLEPEPEPEPAPEPEPEVEPEPELPEPEPVVREAPPDPRPQPEPPPEAAPPPEVPPAAEEAIADFTGETLTNDSGEAWASATGSGEPMEGAIGQPGATVTGRRRRGVRGGSVGGSGDAEPGPTTVPMSDLSRPPSLPNPDRLIELLRRNYPRQARELGIEGTARVRIRVRADGRVVPMAVLEESYEGFGQACRQTLRQGGRFEAPLDRRGEPVDTITAFTCTFRIRF